MWGGLHRYHIPITSTQISKLNPKVGPFQFMTTENNVFDYEHTKILHIYKYPNKRSISEMLHINTIRFAINKNSDKEKLSRKYDKILNRLQTTEFLKPTLHTTYTENFHFTKNNKLLFQGIYSCMIILRKFLENN